MQQPESLANSDDADYITIEDVEEIISRQQMASFPIDSPKPNQQGEKLKPYVVILEQPASRALRFRYECEGRSAGSIPGENSTPENRTFPTIQVMNYTGRAVVIVSCVTKDSPYYPHPHNLVGREHCRRGICQMYINNPDMTCSFTSLGIQCVRKRDMEESLKQRMRLKVDPFRTGDRLNSSQINNIDLNVVRLCFQVFLEGPQPGEYKIPLKPVVSNPIYDKKALSDLGIMKLSHCAATVCGGQEVILLCDKVNKDDLQIYFYEVKGNKVVWEGYGEFQAADVHKNVAVCFRTPRYKDENIKQTVMVNIQLRRPSDGASGDPRPFQLIPREIDPEGLSRKRQKIEEGCLNHFIRENLMQAQPVVVTGATGGVAAPYMSASPAMPFMASPAKAIVKEEAGSSCSGALYHPGISIPGQLAMRPIRHHPSQAVPPQQQQQQMEVMSTEGGDQMVQQQQHISFQAASSFAASSATVMQAAADRMSPQQRVVSIPSPAAMPPPPPPPPPEDSLDEATDKLDSLDLDFDPAQFSLPLSTDNLNFDLTENMSFSSSFLENVGAENANVTAAVAATSSQVLERQMSTSEQRITRLQTELDELNNLCGGVTEST